MKLAIACNHSFPHTGGSEKVVHQISEHMIRLFGWEVKVFSRSIDKPIDHEGVKYVSCRKDKGGFVSQLKKYKPDQTLIYSDCFYYWDDFLRDIDFVPGKKSIALVGMNHMVGMRGSLKKFLPKAKAGNIIVITHSDDYIDHMECEANNIDVKVIPNGVDISEFDNNNISFRNEYNLDDRNIILCVSNYFPGKGQEHLSRVLSSLKDKDNWQCILINSSVNFMPAKVLRKHVKVSLKSLGKNIKFIQDIPREHVVSAFKSAFLFIFPSQKEVAPLVLLESQACSVPWIAMPVGNVRTLNGGIVLPSPGPNKLGFAVYSSETYRVFTESIELMLSDKDQRSHYGLRGREQIENELNWVILSEKYNEIFNNA